jgi:hypothetical protein
MRRQKVLDWMVASITQIQSLLAIFISWFCPAFRWWEKNMKSRRPSDGPEIVELIKLERWLIGD